MKHSKHITWCRLLGVGLFAIGHVCAAGVPNPLVAPPPIVKGDQSTPVPSLGNASPGGIAAGGQVPGLVPGGQSVNQLPGQYNGVFTGQVLELPADKWLAHAVVTSTVGDRASILVPVSFNEAQAANTNQGAPFNGQFGAQFGNFGQAPLAPNRGGMVLGQPGLNQGAMGVGQTTNAAANQPPTALQQLRQEVLFVRSGVPFFFKGERFSVEVSGREVMIWRPSKSQSVRDGRDIIFVGSVSSTEMSRRAVVGAYAPADPTVLKRITPTYGGATTNTGSTQNGGSGVTSGDPSVGGMR